MFIDLTTIPPEQLGAAIERCKKAGLTDADITLMALYQKVQHLRKQQRVYYKTRDKAALRDAMYWSEQVDEMLEMLQPTINQMQEAIQKTK